MLIATNCPTSVWVLHWLSHDLSCQETDTCFTSMHVVSCSLPCLLTSIHNPSCCQKTSIIDMAKKVRNNQIFLLLNDSVLHTEVK
jgi:hypothetical protein